MRNYQKIEDLRRAFPSLTLYAAQRIIKLRPQEKWESDAEKLSQGYPWEYLVEEAEWGELTFRITSPLLIPREETWDWLEKAACDCQGRSIKTVLDLGCGPGTIGLAWNKFFPGAFDLTAVDIRPEAIAIAEYNYKKSSLRAWRTILSDWFDSVPVASFDVIFSNPPYCDRNVPAFNDASFEDEDARYASFGGLQPYCEIFSQAKRFMHQNSVVFIEHGADQGLFIKNLGSFFGLSLIKNYTDRLGFWRASCYQLSF